MIFHNVILLFLEMLLFDLPMKNEGCVMGILCTNARMLGKMMMRDTLSRSAMMGMMFIYFFSINWVGIFSTV
jgi:hypothetical protein